MLRLHDAYLSSTWVDNYTIFSVFERDRRAHEGVHIGRLSYNRYDWNRLHKLKPFGFLFSSALWQSPNKSVYACLVT